MLFLSIIPALPVLYHFFSLKKFYKKPSCCLITGGFSCKGSEGYAVSTRFKKNLPIKDRNRVFSVKINTWKI
jgi:hypothetical protein